MMMFALMFLFCLLFTVAYVGVSMLGDVQANRTPSADVGRTTVSASLLAARVLAYGWSDDAAMVEVGPFSTVVLTYDEMREGLTETDDVEHADSRERRYVAKRGDTQRLAAPMTVVLRFRTRDGEREDSVRVDSTNAMSRVILFHDTHAANACGWRIER